MNTYKTEDKLRVKSQKTRAQLFKANDVVS